MNTGAILNRINFGLSVAAGQLPGAKLTAWPAFDSLRTLPRSQQVDGVGLGKDDTLFAKVDGVVKYMLGGQASPETRDVLMSGANPMLSPNVKGGVANDVNGMAVADDSASMMMPGGGRRGGKQGDAKQAAGGKGFPRGAGAQIPGFGRQVNLQGLAQVVGLALGAPEFQRR